MSRNRDKKKSVSLRNDDDDNDNDRKSWRCVDNDNYHATFFEVCIMQTNPGSSTTGDSHAAEPEFDASVNSIIHISLLMYSILCVFIS